MADISLNYANRLPPSIESEGLIPNPHVYSYPRLLKAALPLAVLIPKAASILEVFGGVYKTNSSFHEFCANKNFKNTLALAFHATSLGLTALNPKIILIAQNGVEVASGTIQIANNIFSHEYKNAAWEFVKVSEKCVYIASIIVAGPELIAITLIAKIAINAYKCKEFQANGMQLEASVHALVTGLSCYGLYRHEQQHHSLVKIKNIAHVTFRELKAACYSGVIFPYGWEENFNYYGLNPKSLSKEQTDKTAILLMHGSGANQSYWMPLAQKLQDRDISPVYTLNFDEENRNAAITGKIEEIRAQFLQHTNSPTKLTLIGHSLGAITSASYTFDNSKPVEGVDIEKVISISGRLKVTDGYQGFYENLISSINGFSDKLDKARLYVIGGDHDPLVPQESIFRADDSHQLKLTNHGHLSPMFAEETINQILNWV